MAYFNHTPTSVHITEIEAVTYASGGRVYKAPTGELLPSVTTVLSLLSEGAIAKWRERVGNEAADAKSKAATDRGSKLHEAIETHLKNESVQHFDNSTQMLLNRLRLILRRINNIVAQEVPLYSIKLGVAGRCDCIAEFDKVLSIIDFKTASKIKLEEWIHSYFLQTTAYALMWEELTGQVIEQIVIIIVGEDSSCQTFVKKRQDYIEDLKNIIRQYKLFRELPTE